ncbi:unnamed protein product [Allacma fusca]|uniref:Uncharacterized protein n=1 Tax=Allacma fusca TaxID=39272 RepID=A0A8J2NU22_9HEXA|nr:unnamed protein product [Allacma fusca]
MRWFPILCKEFSYTQGQYRGKVREYFYYIDHNGMLFMDDSRMKNFTSCFKDVKFLNFFFNRLKVNNTGFYTEHFPYVSPCGIEQNFVRVDDLPIVYTKLNGEDCDTELVINGSGLTFPFDPAKVFMKDNGRIYHAGPEKLKGVGLLSSKLAIQLSPRIVMEDNKCKYFRWKGEQVLVSDEVEKLIEAR